MDSHPGLTLHEITLEVHNNLPQHSTVKVKVVTKVSDLNQTELEHILWTGRGVRSANKIHKVVANNPFEILSTIFSSVEKKLSIAMVTSYATKIPVTHLAATDTMGAEICESWNGIFDQGMIAATRQPKIKVTDRPLQLQVKKSHISHLFISSRSYRGPSRPNTSLLQGSRTLKLAALRTNPRCYKRSNCF